MAATSASHGRVTVTGAGGFIGSHLVARLLAESYRVRALVHYNALGSIGHLAEVVGSEQVAGALASRKLEIVHGDVLDERCVRDLLAGCDQVFHLAALIGIPYSYRAPASYVRVNTLGTLNILEACRELKPERLIVTSTSEVYGSALEAPIAEDHPLQAQSPYSASKIGADKLAEAYHRSFGLPVVTLRPFNTFGPRQSARAIVPTVLAQALSDRCDEIRLGSLSPVRDLTFVEDTAEGYLALARAPLDRVAGGLYNLGSGMGHTIEEIARLALGAAGADKPLISVDERKRPPHSEVDRLIADATRLRKETGWRPRVALEEGLARTADWIRRRPELFQPEQYRL